MASDDPGLNSNGIQIASSEWSDGSAWAPSIEKKNGKYYFYYCGNVKEEYTSVYGEGKAIGVAVADSPTGPYTASDAPIVYLSMMSSYLSDFSGQVIDPSVFTDDDGTSYLFFGNGSAAYAVLSDDMLSVSTSTLRLISILTDFRESIVVFKVDSTYYFTWSCDDTGSEDYHVNYGTATRITPLISSNKTFSYVSYKGTLIEKDTDSDILGTGHQPILYRSDIGKCYITYGRFYTPLGQVGGNYSYHRETCIGEVTVGSSSLTATATQEGITGLCPDGHETTIEYTYPTCAEDGYITISCSGGEYANVITADKATEFAAYGHTYAQTVIEAGCEEDGFTVYTCTRCGDTYSMDYINATGHMFVYDETEESCFKYTCSNCGEVQEKQRKSFTQCGMLNMSTLRLIRQISTTAHTLNCIRTE
ncbi:MAG: family 43 glycosylhydrolase [Clostridiales bacterium]|nr:family 43 glycosylhydrolase [Clostridiales bacterium]